MTGLDKKRALLIAGETACFAGFLVGFVLCVLSLTQYTWYNLVDFLALPEFALMVIFLMLFLALPLIARVAVFQVKRVERAVRKEQLSLEILTQLRDQRRVDVDLLAAHFQLDEADVEAALDRLVESGDIRGTLSVGTFTLQPGFTILDEDARRLQLMEKGFMAFIQPYRFVSLKKVAANFKVPVPAVEAHARALIATKTIRGFLDGDGANLVREISSIALDFTDLPECPYCNNKVLENAHYCSTCGKPIHTETRRDASDLDIDRNE